MVTIAIDKPLNDTTGTVEISRDGNLVIMDGQKEIIWSSNLSSYVQILVQRGWIQGLLVLQDSSNENECDIYGKCGPLASCNAPDRSICTAILGLSHKIELSGKQQIGLVDAQEELPSNASKTILQEKKIEAESTYAYSAGIGCMMCAGSLIDVQKFSNGGADLYIRLAYSELGLAEFNSFIPAARRKGALTQGEKSNGHQHKANQTTGCTETDHHTGHRDPIPLRHDQTTKAAKHNERERGERWEWLWKPLEPEGVEEPKGPWSKEDDRWWREKGEDGAREKEPNEKGGIRDRFRKPVKELGQGRSSSPFFTEDFCKAV
ncbi:UNVERIFIED_CONTAM: G-type lectin S-receptor-like serine/threonine-protein kinase [Sesamum calycinum]|uniref:G-type lectin S-receptor-like serine/threonine-protein kinase n=1 Tax=Sesamum calycinum TaxID=2727403 RepID=A0AAW2MC14_9LAMI